MLVVLGLVAMFGQFYRNSYVVVAPDITRDLGVSPAALGGLAGMLFLFSALFQIPGGMLMDRFSSRYTIAAMLFISMLGATLFALAPGVSALTAARALMGTGTAVIMMAAIIAATRWFDRARFGLVTGVLLGVSQLGNLLATAPVAALAEWIGWRGTFWTLAVATAMLAIATLVLVRDPPGSMSASRAGGWREAGRGVMAVTRIPGIFRVASMSFAAYATLSCIIGLWGGPYLHDVHGLGTTARGLMLAVIAVGLWIGNTLFGWLEHRTGRPKLLVSAGAGGCVALYAAFAIVPAMPLWIVVALFVLLGLIGSFTSMIIAHGRTFYPDHLVGRGMTVVNQAVLLGVAVLHWITGLVVDAFDRVDGLPPPAAYRAVFATIAIALGIALVIYRHAPERGQPRPQEPS